MALKGRAKINQSPHAKTQYIAIPSALTRDSQYPFKDGDEVEIVVDPEGGRLILCRQRGKS